MDISKGTRKMPKKLLRFFVLSLKLMVILACIGFVVRGWFQSFHKYFSGQTSISVVVNESETFSYPSITFCRTFKENVNLVDEIVESAVQLGVIDVNEIDLKDLIDRISYKRTDFLSIFSHPEHGDPRLGTHVLNNDSYWTTFVPHPEYSGLCHTYDPPFESLPAEWFGIRLGFKFSEDIRSQEEKESELAKINFYLHKKDEFTFYEQDDRPNCYKLDTSLFRYNTEMPISLTFHSFTRLSTDAIKCEASPDYNFNRCLERSYSEKRGCQPPWFYFDDIDFPVCNNITELKDKFYLAPPGSFEEQDYTRPRWGTNGLASSSGCPIPCTSGQYLPEISYRNINSWMHYLDNGADWVVYLWFKNFQYDQEFVVCDWTCLLGEIGGNLGFFLGGSILAYVNFVLKSIV